MMILQKKIFFCVTILVSLVALWFYNGHEIMQIYEVATNRIYQSKILSDFKHLDIITGKQLFEDYVNINLKDDSSPCSGGKFLVYRCKINCGGLGDRQKGIASSFLLALLTNRKFIVDIQEPCDVNKHLDPNVYDWTHCKKYVNELPEDQVELMIIGKSKEALFHKTWTKTAVVLRVSGYPILIKAIRKHPDAATQLGWIKNLTDFELIGLVLRSLFKPKPKLRNHLNNFIEESTYGRQLVCGHLRMGRNPNIPTEIAHLKPMNETAMYAILEQFKDVSKYVIYLASDSDLVRERAAIVLKNYVNLNRKIVHIDKFAHLNSRVACDGFYTALFEQYLFTQCDYLIIGRSNFAAMAAYIRGHSRGLYLYNKDRFIPASLKDIQVFYGYK